MLDEQGNWARFHRMVMAAPELRRPLLAPFEREACIAAMLALSRRYGLPLTRDDITAAEQNFGSLPKIATPLDSNEATEVLHGWIPSVVHQTPAGPLIDWVDLGDQRLTEPFFEESVGKARYQPFYRWFSLRTSFSTLSTLMEKEPGIPPTGFLFHLSRCGSTLVTQMLAALEGHIVLSEPEPLDWALRADRKPSDLTEAQQTLWLRAMMSALGRRETPRANRLFVKFDCWHTPLLPRIRRAFPEVPWAFLYRDPVEVLASHAHQPGLHMGNPAEFGPLFGIAADRDLSTEAYRERALTAICNAALEQQGQDPGLFFNYTTLPGSVFGRLADHFGVRFTPTEIEEMQTVTGVHSKQPYRPFAPDSAAKQATGQTTVSADCRARLAKVYRECEEAALATREAR